MHPSNGNNPRRPPTSGRSASKDTLNIESSSGLGAVFAFRPTAWPWHKVIATAVTTSIAMTVGLVLGHLVWGVWMFMGGFTSIYWTPAPYSRRGKTLFWVAIGMAAAMALGSIASFNPWIMAVGLGLVAAISTFVTGAWSVPLPAGFMFVLVACIAAAMPIMPGAAAVRAGFVLIGGGIAWVVGMAGWLRNPHQPEQTGVHQALHAVAEFVRAIATDQQEAAQFTANDALERARQIRTGAARDRWAQAAWEAEELFRAAVALSTSLSAPIAPVWADTIDLQSQRAAHPASGSLPAIPRPPAHHRLWRHFVFQLHATNAALGGKPIKSSHPIGTTPTLGHRLSSALEHSSVVWVAAARIGLAVTFATLLSAGLGSAHPYWVPLTTAAVLQGTSEAMMTERAIQRVFGTLFGIGLAALLLLVHPTAIATAILMVAVQFVMLLFMVKNYGVAVIFVTTLALVIISAEIHASLYPLLGYRLLDTILGAAIGLAANLLLWPRAASATLPDLIQQTLEEAGRLFDRILRGEPKDARLSAQLEHHLLNLRLRYSSAMNELPRGETALVYRPVIASLEQLGFLIATAPIVSKPGGGSVASEVQTVFHTLSAAIGTGLESASEPNVPHIPGYHGIRRALLNLADTLRALSPQGDEARAG